MAGKSYFKGNLSEEELKKKLIAFNDFRKKNTGIAAGEKEMKFLSEMAPSVDDEIFKKIKALIK